MGDYFHGWRRKVGVLTLAMACVFAVGWATSLGNDFAESFDLIVVEIISCDGVIELYEPDDPNELQMTLPDGSVTFPGKQPIIGASYWSIVIPLMMLSAYLLLVKPRAK